MDEAKDRSVPPTEELDHERLRTYLDWAEVRAPAWYWPGLAAGISLWLVGTGYRSLWSITGALLVVAVTITGMNDMSSRSGVTMPSLVGMPRHLRRAYLPFLVATLWLVGVLTVIAVSDGPRLLLGAVTGPLLAAAGASTSGLYRRAAARLAADTSAMGR